MFVQDNFFLFVHSCVEIYLCTLVLKFTCGPGAKLLKEKELNLLFAGGMHIGQQNFQLIHFLLQEVLPQLLQAHPVHLQEIVTELDVVDACKRAKKSEGKKEEAGKNLSHSNSGEWRRISDTSGIR